MRSLKKALIFGLKTTLAATLPAMAADKDWAIYGGTSQGNRYSTLTQINKANVAGLTQAWRFDMAAAGDPQTHPLAIDGMIYAYTPDLKVIALDGASGKLVWTFDSGVEARGAQRGLTWLEDRSGKRLFASVMNYLYALNPATGKPIPSFGRNGRIDLRTDEKFYVSLTTPGVIFKDMIITGFRTGESAPAQAGDIRAFDVHTGRLRWGFHPIPLPGEYGYDTWPRDAWKTAGAANNWAGMAVDNKRGIVYVPTGSPAYDFYGGDRLGDNLFANSMIALDAATGKRIWHFQGVHHDLWDRDFPAPPAMVTVTRDGKRVDAIAQTT